MQKYLVISFACAIFVSQNVKVMKRKEFKQFFIKELEAQGITPEAKAVDSALGKTARHAAAKYGSANWDYEYGEAGVMNAMYFYGEYRVQDTFNRQGYQQSRKATHI